MQNRFLKMLKNLKKIIIFCSPLLKRSCSSQLLRILVPIFLAFLLILLLVHILYSKLSKSQRSFVLFGTERQFSFRNRTRSLVLFVSLLADRRPLLMIKKSKKSFKSFSGSPPPPPPPPSPRPKNKQIHEIRDLLIGFANWNPSWKRISIHQNLF